MKEEATASEELAPEETLEGEPASEAPGPDTSAQDAHDGLAGEAEAADEVGEPAHADGLDGEDAGDEVARLREELETLNDRHLRLAAEFNNFRRRSEQERLAAWGRAQAELLGTLLEVLDDLQRVAELDLGNATVEAIMEGIDLVERKFVRVLGDTGVEVIDPVGEAFDPERMEAMMRVPVEDEGLVDTVAQVFQRGYALKGVLIRPARVSVHTQG